MFEKLKEIFKKKNSNTQNHIQNDNNLVLEIEEYSIYEKELNKLKSEVEYFKKNHNFEFYKPNVGVFGVNSAGKSTFLNALLGEKKFKMGLSETTSEITRLYNSDKIYEIPNVKDEKANFENLKYFNLFDIPGFGKYFDEKILKEVLPYLDIVFWIVDISKGITKEDKNFLNSIKNLDTQIMIIANKIDVVTEDELGGGYQAVENEIKKIKEFFKKEKLSDNLIGIIPLSAKKALVGKLKSKNQDYVLLVEYVEYLLIYSAFIESFKGIVRAILNYLNSDEFINHLSSLLPTYEIVENLSSSLYFDIYDNTSFLDSIFGSKADIAKPIVNRYSNQLKSYLIDRSKAMANDLKGLVTEITELMYVYNKFVSSNSLKFNFRLHTFDPDVYISVYSISANCFFGDSFADEIRVEFHNESLKVVERFINEIIDNTDRELDFMRDTIFNSGLDFSKHLKKSLENKLALQQYLTKELFK